MSDVNRVALATLLLLGASALRAGDPVWRYPCTMLDLHDADGSCWKGMDAAGMWHSPDGTPGVPVQPERWLVGPPPSDLSAVTLPEDHWIHLGFSGRIVDGDGSDIVLLESGQMGEHALVFLTDGGDHEYVAALAVAENVNEEAFSEIELDLAQNPPPFVARGIRIVAVDLGGGSPGFDLASIQTRLSHACGAQGRYPNPISGTSHVDPDSELSWTPACTGNDQVVHFSAVASEVRSVAAVARYPALPYDANSFRPPDLRLAETYYWRVDERGGMDPDHFRAGDLWSFTVSDHLVIDDFQAYASTAGPPIRDVWQPSGWADVTAQTVALPTCRHAMLFDYYLDDLAGSQLIRRFKAPQDWTRGGAKVLQLLLHGRLPTAGGGTLYVALTDGSHEQFVPCSVPPETGSDLDAYPWRIALADFNSIDLTRVRGMMIGVQPVSSVPGGSYRGAIAIADVSLYPAICPEGDRPVADLTADCTVGYRDVEQMAADWLTSRTRTLPIAAPNQPVLWFKFDGNARDSAGIAHGELQGRVNFDQGVHGGAIHFAHEGDRVAVPQAETAFAGIEEQITIAFWQYGDDSSHLNDTVCCSNYEYGKSNPAISINLGCWQNPGQYRWDCGYPWSLENRLAGHHRDKAEWAGRWNHWAFTKDIRPGPNGSKGRMEIYLNGLLYDSRSGTDSPITEITSFEVGAGWYGRYDGLLDDFQIYDYALSPAEVAYLATDATGVAEAAIASPADLDASGRVDLHDFTILATEWLDEALWP